MRTALLLIASLISMAVSAQTQTRKTEVYRCGPDGRELRDSPCPSGHSASGAVNYDVPSQADSRAARERHLNEAKQAGALAQARRASEAEARHLRGQGVGLQTLPPAAKPASAPQVTTVKAPKAAKPPKPPTTPKPPAASDKSGR